MELVRMIHDQTSFTLDLYKQLWQQESKLSPQQQQQQHQGDSKSAQTNAIISPLSIAMAMAMAAAGAKGQTLEQITSVVRLPNGSLMHDFSQQLNSVLLGKSSESNPQGPVMCLANGVWLEQSLKLGNEYKQIIENKYSASATAVDFIAKAEDSRKLINSWVAERTNTKIEELLPAGSVDDQSRLVLTNAIYFKGAWEKQLDPSDTSDGKFHLPSGDTKSVPMMRSRKKQFIKKHESFKVLRLPYQRGTDPRNFSMYVFLPVETQGLPGLVQALDSAETIGNAITGIREVPVGDFQLPKFKISLGIQVPKLFKPLGLDLPFSPPHADFSGITDDPASGDKLFISDVFHKAFVEVNEEGTEAAAATAAVVTLRSIHIDPPEDFVADHPFMFVIREDATGVVLFIGHVNDPTAA